MRHGWGKGWGTRGRERERGMNNLYLNLIERGRERAGGIKAEREKWVDRINRQ